MKNEKLKTLMTDLQNIVKNFEAQLGLINVSETRITNFPK